jgi:hypothetical protein
MHDRTIYAGSVLGLLHHVYVGDVANILDVHVPHFREELIM